MNIVFEGISKSFGQTVAVDKVDFTIKDGEFFTLLGPSGCGKTTLLRIIAAFYRQDDGNLYFGEQLMNDVPAHRRDIGMVFQNYAIFPHLSVFDNVAYGLRARRLGRDQIERRVTEALEMVELGHLRSRSPSDMSGGQQQRIALARAIVIRPQLLLMDEPLSNLDAKLRIKMRSDIRDLQKKLNITTVYVTHDQEEALAVSDRIAVMKGGVIQQIGTPRQVYCRPANQTVASFIGTSNFMEAFVHDFERQTGMAQIELECEAVAVSLKLNRPYSGKALASIRPENIRIDGEPHDERQLAGRLKAATFLGGKMLYKVRTDGGQLLEIEQYITESMPEFSAGQRVFIDLQLERAIFFDASGKEVLRHG